MLNGFFPKHLADRVAGFTGRQWVLDKAAEWIGDSSAPRVLLITGEPGCGKTALAVWLASPDDASGTGPLRDVRSAWAARHFCMAEERRGSVQPARFAQSLAQQIAEQTPEFGPLVLEFVAPTVRGEPDVQQNWGTVIGIQIQNLFITSPDPEEIYDRSVRQPLGRLCKQQPDTRIFILVDALDEALSVGAPCTIVDLLAGSEDLPPGVRFLLTSRPEPKVLEKFPSARLLNLSARSFSGAVNDDVRAYIEQRAIPSLSPPIIESLVTAAEGNFLYVRILLDEIARGARKVDDFAALPIGLHSLYRTSLDRLTDNLAHTWRTRYQPVLGRLSVAAADIPQELLGEWTAQADQTASTLYEIFQLVESTVGSDGALKYRLYHRSIADFLALPAYRTNSSTLPNPYHTPPLPQHKAIVDFYRERFAENCFAENWYECDEYGLRHLVGHMARCIDLVSNSNERATIILRLYVTLLDGCLGDAQQQKLGELAVVLADLRTGLRVALSEKDLAKAVAILGRYREAQGRQRLWPTVFESVRQGNLAEALKRAEAYQSVPKWGRSLFLYLAWEAARCADTELVKAAVNAAWNSPISKGPYLRQSDVDNALFAHVALLLSQMPGSSLNAEGWIHELDPDRQHPGVDSYLKLTKAKPTLQERDFRDLDRLSRLEAEYRLSRLEAEFQGYGQERGYYVSGRDFAEAEAIAIHADELAEILGNLLPSQQGQERLDKALDSVAKNPYSAYRDIALVALGTATLSSGCPSWAAERLRRILQAALDQEGVTFTFDLAAVLSHEAEHRCLAAAQPEVTSASTYGLHRNVYGLHAYCAQALHTIDSWGTKVRALSAQSAALFRQGDCLSAFLKLEEAAQEPHGFAGFFALHYLALANRWQEFGIPTRCQALIEEAANCASHVQSYEFREQREQLVKEYRSWCNQETPTLPEAIERLSAFEAYETRMAYLEHISARWAATQPPNLDAIEAVLFLALSDPTVLDGLLARFVGLQLKKLADRDLAEAIRACNQFLTSGRPWNFFQPAGVHVAPEAADVALNFHAWHPPQIENRLPTDLPFQMFAEPRQVSQMLSDQGWAKQAVGLTERVAKRIKSDPLGSWIEREGYFTDKGSSRDLGVVGVLNTDSSTYLCGIFVPDVPWALFSEVMYALDRMINDYLVDAERQYPRPRRRESRP